MKCLSVELINKLILYYYFNVNLPDSSLTVTDNKIILDVFASHPYLKLNLNFIYLNILSSILVHPIISQTHISILFSNILTTYFLNQHSHIFISMNESISSITSLSYSHYLIIIYFSITTIIYLNFF